MTSQFGKYSLQRKLAEGGMAELFLAKQEGMEGFEKLVVVKRILPQLCSDDSFVTMFLNEARVAARLNHPNVVQIFDLGKIVDQYFIAMEYVHGEDLRALIRAAEATQRRPSTALVCRILADTLAGLHYAHTRSGSDGKPLGLVHRDVSPQNVIVTYEGSVKLVDFGIAKATREVGAAQTQAGLLKGKYAYMAPEQARGQQIDARADIFAVGILLWELVTWQRLYKRPTELATLMAVVNEPAPSPRTVDPTIPAELDWLIMKALDHNPDNRFASAQDMRAALENLIRANAWQADSLALTEWMHDLFADKLHAQAADVAAAGLGSVEDFLLRVEEKSSISWIQQPSAGEKKTPSSGLPPSGNGEPANAPKVPKAPLASSSGSPPPAAPSSHTAAGHGPGARPQFTSAPTVVAEQKKPPILLGETVPMLPHIAGVINARPVQTAPPHAPTIAPFDAARTTLRHPAQPRPPQSGYRRGIVIATAAALVAALALTILLWPAPSPPALDPPAPASGAGTAASPSSPPPPSSAPAKSALASLRISIDTAAQVAVDGYAVNAPTAPGSATTVEVQPGVAHVVTAQRAGHSPRRQVVPPLRPGQQLPIDFKLR